MLIVKRNTVCLLLPFTLLRFFLEDTPGEERDDDYDLCVKEGRWIGLMGNAGLRKSMHLILSSASIPLTYIG